MYLRSLCCATLLCCGALAQAQTHGSCCVTGANKQPVACTLTSTELAERKATVLAALKEQVIERKELEHGYAYTFPGSDEMVDRLVEFIKTERSCCAFFTFGLTVAGDKSTACLELTGPEGTKAMIETELGL